jgi:hypothetical protein
MYLYSPPQKGIGIPSSWGKGGGKGGYCKAGYGKGPKGGAVVPMMALGYGSPKGKGKFQVPGGYLVPASKRQTGGPLSKDVIAKMKNFIMVNGGAVKLGKLGSAFEGVKRKHLEEHFHVEEPFDLASGDAVISLSGSAPFALQEDSSEHRKKKRSRRKAGDDAPVIEMDEARVEEIEQHLQENGGVLSLGKLSTVFEGLKKAQLEQHFQVIPTEKDFEVRSMGDALFQFEGEPSEPKRKKRKKDRDPNAPVEELGAVVVQEIEQFLQENGGVLALGRVTTVFEGVKKAQLEQHFIVNPTETDFEVRLHGTAVKSLLKNYSAVKTEREPYRLSGPLDDDTVQIITDWLADEGGYARMGKLSSDFPGVKKAQLEPHFDVMPMGTDMVVALFGHMPDPSVINDDPMPKRSRVKKERDPNPPALDQAKVEQIQEWIVEQGGSVSIGKLSTVFEGVKKAQLDGPFVVTLGPVDSVVSIH